MREPFISSKVFDMTGGLLPAPADDGYNIALSVFTPTGPIEKTKVLSQKDFINKYMTGTIIRPDDNMSAIFAYLLLAQNPLYIVRGCPVTFLEGITSKGNRLLFDKEYKLVPSYFKFKLEEIKDALKYYYIKAGNYAYTTGDDAGIESSDIDNETKVKVNTEKSIDKLVENLIDFATENDLTFPVLKSDNGTIITRKQIDKKSSNIGKFDEIARSGIFKTIESNARTVNELDYIAENGTTYYFRGENTHEVTSLTNPVAIESPDGKGTMDSRYFMLKVLAKTQSLFSGLLTIELKDYSGSGKDAKFEFTDVPGLKVSAGKVKINRMVTFNKGTVGSYAIKFKGIIETKAGLPNSNLVIGDKYLVKTDESHDNKKYIYTAISATEFDSGEAFVEFDALSTRVKIDTKEFTFVVSSEVSKDESLISLDVDNSAEFLTSVIDYLIANNPTLYKSNANLNIEGNIKYYSNSSNGSLSSKFFEVKTDTDEDFTYYYSISNDKNNEKYISYEFLWLTVGNFLYYTGKMPKSFTPKAGLTTVQMSRTTVNKEQFISLLYKNLYTTQKIGMYMKYFVSSAEKELEYDTEIMTVKSSTVIQNSDEQFAVIQMFPSTESVFKFSYNKSKDDDRIIELTLNFKDGSVVENWTMSFVPGVSDGYGIDQWYTRVKSNNFKIVSLTDEGVTGEIEDKYSSPSFGSNIGVPEYDVQYLKDAISTISSYEDGVHYDMISDSGIVDPGFASTCEKIADELFSIYPVSLPESTQNENDIISFVGAANIKSWQSRMLAAGDRIPVSGFTKPIPGSYKLILQVLGLFRNKSVEFAANFDLIHGTVGTSNLIQVWKKPAREKLLDYKIATLKGGISTPFYINDNVTAQPSKSYMSEDQNVRMTNTAVHLIEDFVQPYKSEFNTAATRQKVQDGANRALQDRLFRGKQYSPALYKAVCDENNNPSDVIDGNQLVVDLYASFTPSIKYVLVNHYVVPLSQAENY